MTGLSFPDLSVQISQRRWRCVLDPNLALSPNGAAFARRLAPHAEVWIGSEFFNILDSALIYEHEPELLGTSRAAIETVPEVLRDWTRLRDETGYGGGLFHWIGDILRESCLPNGMDEGIIAHWEAAARSLDLRLPQALEASGPLIAAMRDTVALCAILPARQSSRCVPPTNPKKRRFYAGTCNAGGSIASISAVTTSWRRSNARAFARYSSRQGSRSSCGAASNWPSCICSLPGSPGSTPRKTA